MPLKLERGDDAEVAAAAADRPEQVGVLVFARGHDFSGCEYDFGREEVVDRHSVASHQPAQASTECESRDASARHHAAWGGETERPRRAVQLADRDAPLG